MKKLATLLLAAGMVFSAATGASAIDFKAKGQWIMSFDYGEGGNFMHSYRDNNQYGWNGRDDFEADQRVRLQLDAVASEALSGTVYFEIGKQFWGEGGDKSTGGAALGADSTTVIKLKAAYIDWMIPETDLKIRMGIQHVAFPSYTIGTSIVMDDDVAGITASYKINDMVSITAGWMRPFNDNFKGYNRHGYYYDTANYMDNADFGYLLVPLTFDGAKVTPWGMYGAIGPNTFRQGTDYVGDSSYTKGAWNYAAQGLFPVGGARNGQFRTKNQKINSYGEAWWLGATGEVTVWDPFRIAWDFAYGSVTWSDNGSLNRQGWLASLLFEYKMDWGIPGIYGWYGSGDDNNPANGSERIPSLSSNNTNQFSNYAFNGDKYIARDQVLSADMAGTWGIGIRLKDMSFIEDLKHTFRINYISGTNSTSMAKKMSREGMWANGSAMVPYTDRLNGREYGYGTKEDPSTGIGGGYGFSGLYMTTEDHALEFGLTNTYQMYENFTINLEADYIALWLDTSKSVWGSRHKYGQSIPNTMDSWNINASFIYSF